ncbi:MBL fold metallo-hydrolase [Cellulosimicrobium sp. NPDC057127]|uniref:MBL fold metallo-hydrolase n=1 Tax=Cellulosimicrobium sp. NPDC057127 TaxID=3346026 RepID=UPI00363E6281
MEDRKDAGVGPGTAGGASGAGGAAVPVAVHVVVAPVFGTNCAVVVLPGAECVVVDAGAGVADRVVGLVEREGLVPRAVLATHGHVDHTWDAAALCERLGVPLVLHEDDAYRLPDPFGTIEDARAGVSGPLAAALRDAGARPEDYREPRDVRPFAGGPGVAVPLVAPGLHAVPAPGHTEGSSLFLAGAPGTGVLLSGDVLFAGSVGRTDLPGGDGAVMARTLRDVVGGLDPRWDVLPGHGPATTVAHERATNPFLARG